MRFRWMSCRTEGGDRVNPRQCGGPGTHLCVPLRHVRARALACKNGLGQFRGQGAAVRDVPQQVALAAHSVRFRGLRKKGEARGASS